MTSSKSLGSSMDCLQLAEKLLCRWNYFYWYLPFTCVAAEAGQRKRQVYTSVPLEKSASSEPKHGPLHKGMASGCKPFR